MDLSSMTHAIAGALLLVVAAGLPPATMAQAATQPAVAVDAIFAPWVGTDSPGCSVGVSQAGHTVLERGYGMASLELSVPITAASVFHVASVSKPFTALSILLLARDGKLSLDDQVLRHVPEWVGPPVTIRQLLTHTSGIRDVFLLTELAAVDDSAPIHDRLVALLANQRGGAFAPGTRQVYDNGAYLLLGEIVRRVSGQSLRAFLDTRILKPLGMTSTHAHDDAGMVVPKLATGYTRDARGLRLARSTNGIVGNGGLHTTAGDLLRWTRDLATPAVGDAAIYATMQTLPVLPPREKVQIGHGLWMGTHRGWKTVSHGGGDQGASAFVVRVPDRDLAVAVLCNLDEIDATGLAYRVADLYLPADADPAPAAKTSPTPATPVTLTAAQLAVNEGLFHDPREESLLRIMARDGRLFGSTGAGFGGGWPMTALGANRWVIDTTSSVLEFSAPDTGAGRTLRVTGERPQPIELERLQPYAPAAAALTPLAGDYRSEDLATTYTLAVRDGALTIRIPGRKPFPLQPIRPDAFAGPLVGVITFTRGPNGQPSGFTVHEYRAKGIRFARARS